MFLKISSIVVQVSPAIAFKTSSDNSNSNILRNRFYRELACELDLIPDLLKDKTSS